MTKSLTIVFGVLMLAVPAMPAATAPPKAVPPVIVFHDHEVPVFVVVEKDGRKQLVIRPPSLQPARNR